MSSNLFEINAPESPRKIQVVCAAKSTAIGFKHEAKLFIDGVQAGVHAVSYYENRTWERYQFESVLKRIIEKNLELGVLNASDLMQEYVPAKSGKS